MRLLTVNWGSSSLKCAVVDAQSGEKLRQQIWRSTEGPQLAAASLANDGVREFLGALPAAIEPEAVVHRIVHGGAEFCEPVVIDDAVRSRLEKVSALAPLHNPPALALVDALRASCPSLPHIAAFDTAFHANLPLRARSYALPPQLCGDLGIRRFGFHGLNHAHVMRTAARHMGVHFSALRVVSVHLGSGASVAAIEHGICTETSMGMTPLEGLVMGSRAGDLDPGIVLTLIRQPDATAESVERLLLSGAGLQGMTGTPDFRAVEARAAAGDETCRLALSVYGHRVRKYIGAYAAVMGGVDAIVFTGGVGENSAAVRSRCLQRLGFLGAILDERRNSRGLQDADQGVAEISASGSLARLLVVAANEELEMAREAQRLLTSLEGSRSWRVPVAVSAHHAHLSQPTIDQLFGQGYQLTFRNALAQKGQFAARETVSLVGPAGRLENVRLIGPPRDLDQIEISRSDEHLLGVDAPVRISGQVAGSPGVLVEGPSGRVSLPQGLICARRHVHVSKADAERWGVRDGQRVAVRLGEVTYQEVCLRVAPSFVTELHLDTDEANAAAVKSGDQAVLVLDAGRQTV